MNAETVTALLQERLDYWLPGGKGLRSVLLPELAQEIAVLFDERIRREADHP